MTRWLEAREGADDQGETALPARAVSYLMSVFHGAHPADKVGIRTCKELRVIAEAMGALASGQLPHLGDLLDISCRGDRSASTN